MISCILIAIIIIVILYFYNNSKNNTEGFDQNEDNCDVINKKNNLIDSENLKFDYYYPQRTMFTSLTYDLKPYQNP